MLALTWDLGELFKGSFSVGGITLPLSKTSYTLPLSKTS